jgi:hypothetical protein
MRDAGGMDPSIDATILLCDAASGDPSGKMHMLGAGWSITGSPTAPCSVVVLLKVPWERADGKLPFVLRLVDADGHPVVIEGKAVGIRQELGIGRRAQVPAGVPIDASFNLNLGPMPLPAGRYRWLLEIGEEAASAGFTVVTKHPS